ASERWTARTAENGKLETVGKRGGCAARSGLAAVGDPPPGGAPGERNAWPSGRCAVYFAANEHGVARCACVSPTLSSRRACGAWSVAGAAYPVMFRLAMPWFAQ